MRPLQVFLVLFSVLGIFTALITLGIKADKKWPTSRDISFVSIDGDTGCQYLQNPNGGITPRIDADGVHMGCKGLQGERK